jgi:hypothetical protein
MIPPNAISGKQFQLPVLSTNAVNSPQASFSATPSTITSVPSVFGDTQDNPLLQSLASLQQSLTLMTQTDAAFDYNSGGGGGATNGLQAPGNNIVPNDLANLAIQRNRTANPQQRQQLDSLLAKVANDPEGSRLLQAALANGYTIEIGDPAATGVFDSGVSHDASLCAECQAALDGSGQINGVTIPGQKKIVVNPNAENVTKTLIHELGHAATEADGNSKDEEGKVDVIGYRVAERITGIPAPPNDPNIDGLTKGRLLYRNKVSNPAYANLQETNGVDRILNSLGIFA